ncbi:stress response protein [Neoasaia chiangmaiensis NBRC 101099]|uniref:Uncharacterized protein n=1 Tax=Neoasaia chiangmaiensis TaxID=320497 RepID=A0A1U9KQD8_9PROT|nr:DUF2382 domain-containing protein [Neoasaia chiangmaiensis]AQS88013.1 hypothetical protein A0U93_08730 [Neoasaia chiangmaiensis]GBR38846.1 stress response protein [Neoasaia chiangmaiensis NBRC 101099]GEN15683.1 hypothetical protein NCH01_21140 [Neoasaia chiangmaiensis]
MNDVPKSESRNSQILQLHEEELTVERVSHVTGEVRVSITTQTQAHEVREILARERVTVENVPVGRIVDELPRQRQEGDTTIIPVVEEVVEVRKRYRILEEVHIRRVAGHVVHEELIDLHHERVSIQRNGQDADAFDMFSTSPVQQESEAMSSETIVAVFDEPTAALRAIEALESAGVPRNAIHHYDRHNEVEGENIGDADVETHHQTGFWSWLTGSDTGREHHAFYDQTVKSGGTVVTVVTDAAQADRINSVLQEHGPIDLDERHSEYSASGVYGEGLPGTATGDTANADRATQDHTSSEQVIPLAEEELEVGKRDVDRGTTRVRRYTVSRPVSEQIRLRDESISVLRRPVERDRAVGADAFTDREISATEVDEEAVVHKSAHVVEEVVLKKDVSQHDETIQDTVRREEIEVDGPKGHDVSKIDDGRT